MLGLQPLDNFILILGLGCVKGRLSWHAWTSKPRRDYLQLEDVDGAPGGMSLGDSMGSWAALSLSSELTLSPSMQIGVTEPYYQSSGNSQSLGCPRKIVW